VFALNSGHKAIFVQAIRAE